MTARNVLFGTLLLGMCALVASGQKAPTKTKSAAPAKAAGAKEEHSAMLKEHQQAQDEHDTTLAQLGQWRIEHRRALVTLQAKTLEHNASLEKLAEHARIQEDHIRYHEE